MHLLREEAFILNCICAWLVSGWIAAAVFFVVVGASLPIIVFTAAVPIVATAFCIHMIREGVAHD